MITDAGKPSMQMIVKKGEKIEKYQPSGQVGGGDGEKAGVACRTKDGGMLYVPESADAPAAAPPPRIEHRSENKYPLCGSSRCALDAHEYVGLQVSS